MNGMPSGNLTFGTNTFHIHDRLWPFLMAILIWNVFQGVKVLK